MKIPHRESIHGKPSNRGRRSLRPICESLEGRALLSVAAVDPSFNGGQPVVNPTTETSTSSNLNTGAAGAVQTDGKIIVAGTIRNEATGFNSTQIAVRRYNANGTLDTTFGTNGEIDLAMPAGTYDTATVAPQVLIEPNGKIVLAASLAQSSTSFFSGTTYKSLETVAFGLNANGSVDSTFGTAGQTVISTDTAALTNLALQADGKIVLGGLATTATTGTATTQELAVTRLNANGSVDSTFNGGNLLELATATYGGPYGGSPVLAGLFVTPGQKIALVTSNSPNGDNSKSNYEIVEFNADGTPNTTFGPSGIVQGTITPYQMISTAAMTTDGKFVLVGADLKTNEYLTRVRANGSVDTSFANPTLSVVPTSIVVQADGKVVLGSASTTQFITARYTAAGVLDGTFGSGGQVNFATTPLRNVNPFVYDTTNALTLAPNGQVVLVGTVTNYLPPIGTFGRASLVESQLVLARLRSSALTLGDYDGDGKADIAAELSTFGAFAIRKSTGGDAVATFGPKGIGLTIPAPGDYDGDGITDIAAYLPQNGALVYRPSSGGNDVSLPFGPKGAGNSIPAPGDYDGDGITDVAVYIPAMGEFAIHPSSGVANYLVPFGTSGVGKSIPAPGDYDGDGKTDPAVYLTSTGTLAYRSSAGNGDVLTQFGPAGMGASIPAPGDYDGDGKTDIAIFMPASATFAIRPSSGVANYLAQFGTAGNFQAVPAPGDYDGDGKTDLAVYLPTTSYFAYRPSSSGADVLQGFGAKGFGQTIPASSSYATQPPASTGANSNALAAAPAVLIPLTDDLTTPTTAKKKTTTSTV